MPSRSSAPADSRARLLRAGLALVRKRGLRALTVRGVAAQAEANLGSFVYHFGSRDAFVEALIERLYAPLFARLELAAAAPGDALSHLRAVMLQLVSWLARHRVFLAHLVLDAGAGEAGALRFLRSLDQRHPALLLRLIGQAQQAGQLRRDEPLHQMLFLMTTLAAPVLLFQLVGQRGMAPAPLATALTRYTIEPEQVALRLDWALRGLAP